ncbi:MAG: hypothetical protein IPK72_22005 [Candidatus Eisenbacteria bacterium]|nr:hypothetical protein [Candidatus Eisenbacteria bacterium]
MTEDLQHAGAVLPARLKLALGGLRTLKSLTVAAYERQGGAVGLEAAFVHQRLIEAAQHSGLAVEKLRCLLMALIDRQSSRSSGSLMKTTPKPSATLMKMIGAHQEAFDRAVTDLCDQKKTVLRRQVLPDTGEEQLVLDHDYLCAAVVEEDRRANRWQREQKKLTRNSCGPARAEGGNKWRALVTPSAQLRFLWHRLRGKLRFGTHRTFAALSALRWIPTCVLLLGITAGTWEARAWLGLMRNEESARLLLARIGNDKDTLSSAEISALYELAQADEDVRISFLRQALLEGNTIKLVRRMDWIAHAVVGLSNRMRNRVFREVWIETARLPAVAECKSLEVSIAWIHLGQALSLLDHVSSEETELVFRGIVGGMEKVSDANTLRMLARSFQAPPRKAQS